MLQRIAAKIQTAWSMVGITLLLVVAIDAGLQHLLLRRSEGMFASAIRAYPDPDHGWVDEYIREASEGDREAWRPYVYWRRLPYAGPLFKVNADGLRETWNAPHAAGEKVVRIFALGGSTTWGTGARADYNFPSWLSRHLNDAGVKVEVTNFGEGGYVSTQELLTLLLELRKGNVPDVAVFLDGVNDVIAAYQAKKAGIPQNESNREDEFRADEKRSRWQKFVRMFPGLLQFSEGLGKRFAKPYTVSDGEGDASALEADVAHVYRENVRVVEALGREYGFRPVFYWQPMIFEKDRLAPNEVAAAKSFEYLRKFIVGSYAAIRSDGALAGDPRFHDVSEMFRTTDIGVFADYLHLSERGNSILAQRVAADIEQLLHEETGGDVPTATR